MECSTDLPSTAYLTNPLPLILTTIWNLRVRTEQCSPVEGKSILAVLQDADLADDLIIDCRIIIEDMLGAKNGDPGYRLEYPTNLSPEKELLVGLGFALGKLQIPRRKTVHLESSAKSDPVEEDMTPLKTVLQLDIIRRELGLIPVDHVALDFPIEHEGRLYTPKQLRALISSALTSFRSALTTEYSIKD